MIDLQVTVVDASSGRRAQLQVRGPVGLAVGACRAALLAAVGSQPGSVLSMDGVGVADDDRFDDVVLHGSLLVAGHAVERTARPAPLLELHVVGGPDAGATHPLGPGRHLVGRSQDASIPLRDPEVSRRHCILSVDAGRVQVLDERASNGTEVDGGRLHEPRALRPGERLRAGSSTLVLRVRGGRPSPTRPDGTGRLLLSRSARSLPPPAPGPVRRPQRPVPRTPARVPWLAAGIPLLAGVPVAAFLHQPTFLLFSLLGPLGLLGSVLSDRLGIRREHAAALVAWGAEDRRAREQLQRLLELDLARRRARLPDPAAVLGAARSRTDELWPRTRDDADGLALSPGCGRVPSAVRLEQVADPLRQSSTDAAAVAWHDDAPDEVVLGETGHLAVCGAPDQRDPLGRWLLAQVAAGHSPRDVHLRVLGDEASWGWTGLLPHTLPSEVEPLDDLLAARWARADHTERTRWPRHVVAVVDGDPDDPALAAALRDGPRLGVHVLWLATDPHRVPQACTTRLVVEQGAVTRLATDGSRRRLRVDGVSPRWAWRFARAMAPLRDASPPDGAEAVPHRVSLTDLLGPGAAGAAAIATTWAAAPRSTRAPLGVDGDGVVTIDLVRDGPHALVAGTTGAGKSELLQSLVVSLAARNRPDELTFVLVDYKGGSTFDAVAGLPHVVGVVTDLDDQLTRRALTSLRAELARRERLLLGAGARDLEAYQRRTDGDDGAERLPRLVLVVDEFRALAQELPQFVEGVVRLAAVGRSLGIHVVLATQRPAGVVTPDIRANTNLRIALRVRDRADSDDVLDAPDAAHLPADHPGRAVWRSADGVLRTMQVARAGAPGRTSQVPVSVTPVGAADPVERTERDERAVRGAGPYEAPLRALAHALGEASARSGCAAPASPWLPPLPDRWRPPPTQPSDGGVALGLLDQPEQQLQPVLWWSPSDDGHLGVVGAARSGRTTALTSAVVAACRSLPPERLHVHLLDAAGGGLTALAGLPHVGTALRTDRPALTARLVRRLSEELRRVDASETAAGGQVVTLLVVDGWESAVQALEAVDHGRPVDDLIALARDGAAHGLRLLVAGGRGLLLSRVANLLDQRLLLRPADPSDLLLAGVPDDLLSGNQPAGRAVAAVDGTLVQLAAPPDDLPHEVQAVAAAWAHASAGSRPRRRVEVRPLPRRVELAQVLTARSADTSWVPVGLGGDDGHPVGLDLAAGTTALVCGPRGSGRSSCLRTVAAAAAARGREVVLVGEAPDHDAPGLDDGVQRLPATEVDAGTLQALGARLHDPRTLLLVDDLDQLDETPLGRWLETVLRARQPVQLVASTTTSHAAHAFRGAVATLRAARTGVLLQPAGPADGEALGVTLPPCDDDAPGRGLLVTRGAVVPVQVAIPEPARALAAAAPAARP
ncbi:FtsK/SpoIIIE domain-containing protein [Angustibacter aerolatus]